MYECTIFCLPAVITDRHLYEGDIDLTAEQRAAMEAISNPNDLDSPQRAVVRHTRSLWRNGRVPYLFDGSIGAGQLYILCII